MSIFRRRKAAREAARQAADLGELRVSAAETGARVREPHPKPKPKMQAASKPKPPKPSG
jgi:hypothetical protein